MGMYEVIVEDVEGCSNNEMVYVGVVNDDIIVDFIYDMQMFKVDFINNSFLGIYYWDFGNGIIFDEKDLWIEFVELGIYQVCLFVINDCGIKICCEYIELVIFDDVVILDVGEKLGFYGFIIYVFVMVDNCDLIVLLVGSFEMEDIDVVEIFGVSFGVIELIFNLINNIFNYYDNNGIGVMFDLNEVFFNIVVKLKGLFGEMLVIFIIDDLLMVEVGSIENGQLIVKLYVILSGKVIIIEYVLVEGMVNNYKGIGIEDV